MLRSLLLSATILAAGLASLPVRAQTDQLTEQQIEEAFSKQKTRGLSIAPPVDAAETAAEPESATEGSTQVTYVEVPKDEQVNINIRFDFDSAALRDDQKTKLDALCRVIKNSDIPVFRIVGHTDSAGSADYNENLSLLRAEEVKRHLETDCGIAGTRLEAVGVGAQFPYDESNPRDEVNRRVEFQALS